jgi:hypothetical protein
MNHLIRLIINFTIIAVTILLFRHLGWISLTNPPDLIADQTVNDILIAGIIGLIIFIIGEIAGVLFTILIVVTCGLGCLLYPIYGMLLGYIKLYGTQYILTDWFIFERDILKVVIMSIAVGLIRIPSIKERRKIVYVRRVED